MFSVWGFFMMLALLSAIVMVGLILLQQGKGADMGSSFGAGASGSLFGASGSANPLSKATAIAAAIFLASTLALTYIGYHRTTAAVGKPVDSVLNSVASGAVPGAAIAASSAASSTLPAVQTPAAPAVAAPTDAASVQVEGGVVKFYFASAKADLADGADQALANIVAGAKAGKKVSISGFTDSTGSAQANAELAKRRAQAVQAALVKAGVVATAIELKKPQGVQAGDNAAARRVEVSLQ